MAGIPGREPLMRRVFGTSVIYEFILAPLAVVTTFVAAFDFFWHERYWRAIILTAGGLIVLCAGLGKAFINWKQAKKSKSIHELEGALHTLHATLDGLSPNGCLRVTMHRVLEEHFEQVMDYVGDGRGRDKTAHRIIPKQCGIIGEAMRQRQPVVAYRTNENYESYVKELVSNWHFSEADARRMQGGSMSWMAVPLVECYDGVQEVRGIVYLDSTNAAFFTEEIQKVVNSACGGIARFVAKRYY